jgi:molybdenum-dependent DNA-binding transcriptional regulator ModE
VAAVAAEGAKDPGAVKSADSAKKAGKAAAAAIGARLLKEFSAAKKAAGEVVPAPSAGSKKS